MSPSERPEHPDGHESPQAKVNRSWETLGQLWERVTTSETILGTYCRGCLKILDEEDIEPGQHKEYTLMEGEA